MGKQAACRGWQACCESKTYDDPVQAVPATSVDYVKSPDEWLPFPRTRSPSGQRDPPFP